MINRRQLVIAATGTSVLPNFVAAQGTPPAAQGTPLADRSPGRINAGTVREVAPGVHVIEDRESTPFVPNVTIVEGRDAVLVVDTGLGPANGQTVYDVVQRLAPGKPIYLTLTHFHPEHGFGVQAFAGRATILYNRTQLDEFQAKRDLYLGLFATLGLGGLMDGITFVEPERTYDAVTELDLGNRTVTLTPVGPAHTLGDQIITVPDAGVAVLGDLLETNSYPIYPWFPDFGDTDVDPVRWLEVLRSVEADAPTVVIPGHGPVSSVADVTALAAYIALARDEVLSACAGGADLETVRAQVAPTLRAAHPEWLLPEWVNQHIETTHSLEC